MLERYFNEEERETTIMGLKLIGRAQELNLLIMLV
jgi:hypothetical protein